MTGEELPDLVGPSEREIEEELRFHIEGRIEALVASGLTEAEARRRVHDAFGDVVRIREECRRIDEQRIERERRRRMLGGWWRDVRLAVRRLVQAPGYTVVALLTLALGVGAAVGMFSVVNAVLLRPLPYPDAERLVAVWPTKNFNITLEEALTAPAPSIAASTGISQWGLTLTGEGPPRMIQAEVVDPEYFEVFGVRPALGRAFRPEDMNPSQSDVVILGDRLWRARFGADPGVVGRRIQLDGYDSETREVVGVMPREFRSFNAEIDVWLPFHVRPGITVAQDSSWYVNSVVARIAPGATVVEASADVRTLARRIHDEFPFLWDEDQMGSVGAVDLLDSIVGDVGRTLWLLLAAVGLVLLIACANLANLLLSRGERRRRDVAVRAALGASRGRLIRQHVVESLVLAVVGGAGGVLLAWTLLELLAVADAAMLPRGGVAIDLPVLGFALAVSLGSVLIFGMVPALRATSGDLRGALMAGGRGTSGSRRGHRLNRALVTAEIALAVVLVTGAGLMLNSFRALRSVDPGLDPDDVLAVSLLPASTEYQDERLRTFYDQVMERVRALPGVESVGGIHLMPFTRNNWNFPYLAEGHTAEPNEPLPAANFRIVSPGYFDAVDIPLLAGRDITPDDGAGERVALINATFAEQLWPGEDPIGRTINLFGNMQHRVIGVVGDVRQHALDLAPRPEMYVPGAQWGQVAQRILMIEGPGATTELAPAVRQAIWDIGPDVPVTRTAPLSEVLGASLERERFFAGVLGTFGVLALLLGAVGVYGVMSTMVGTRLPDYGVRMAFGAAPETVVREAVGTGLRPVAIGLAIGLATALASARLLAGLLFGVTPFDIPTYVVVAVVLGAAGLLAAWLPARRAGRVDPVRVMRTE